jgi:pyruvate dehydrogenase E2 component (dihydrolipoamide acetyltransferase)
MDKVLKLREVFNKTLGEKDKTAKLSVNDFVVKAVACALADVPEANSAWLGEVIRT